MPYTKVGPFVDVPEGSTPPAGADPISAATLNTMENGIAAAAELTASEGVKLHDGSAGGGTRPSGYVRVRWVGGTTRPTNMITGDVWERDV